MYCWMYIEDVFRLNFYEVMEDLKDLLVFSIDDVKYNTNYRFFKTVFKTI